MARLRSNYNTLSSIKNVGTLCTTTQLPRISLKDGNSRHLVTTNLVSFFWGINPRDAFSNGEVPGVLHINGGDIIVVVSTLKPKSTKIKLLASAQIEAWLTYLAVCTENMRMLYAEIKPGVVTHTTSAQADERGIGIVKMQPLLDLFISGERCLGEVGHHVKFSLPFVHNKNTAKRHWLCLAVMGKQHLPDRSNEICVSSSALQERVCA